MFTTTLLLLAAQSAPSCDLAAITTARAAHQTLSRRAVEVITLAATGGSDADATLQRMINPAASFDLGAGDVGRPQGSGVAGARALARTMRADQFRFLDWNYMDMPADACERREVTIEFIDTSENWVSQVLFTFDQGRVVSAKGWQRLFVNGSMPVPSGIVEVR